MVAVIGNTYPVREQLKAIGGRWNPEKKVWMVPDEKAEQARQIVNGAKSSDSYRPHKCKTCGIVQSLNYRGFPNVRIYRSGECQDCYEERKMGY